MVEKNQQEIYFEIIGKVWLSVSVVVSYIVKIMMMVVMLSRKRGSFSPFSNLDSQVFHLQ